MPTHIDIPRIAKAMIGRGQRITTTTGIAIAIPDAMRNMIIKNISSMTPHPVSMMPPPVAATKI
jgi:hypothetical protein